MLSLSVSSAVFAQEEPSEGSVENSVEHFALDTKMLEALSKPLREYREGRIAPARRTRLAVRIEGVVKEVWVTENSKVQRGDILLEMDCSIERAQLEEARLAHRLEKLRYEEIKAQKEDPQALQTTTLSIELKLAHLNSIREKVKYCKITAPHDGKVTKVLVGKHEGVPAFTNVVEMTDGAPPELHFSIPQDWLGEIAIEGEFEIQVGGEGYRVVLFRVAVEPDSGDNSFPAIAKVIDKKPITLGSKARVYKDNLTKTASPTKQDDAR